MIYQFTGQPGHGKTLHALDKAIDFRDQGRLVHVCNVRGFDARKARMVEIQPEQFIDWQSLPDGSVVLVDECYEHNMLPKRGPGTKVPEHVQQLAKHRHRGFDFIFVTQSPSKQMDEFVHDLIERHVHVRRRFGLPVAHLRVFDRYEKNPEKSHPLELKRVRLPRRPMGLYQSTEMDTTEKRVPWYYYAAVALLVFVVGMGFYMSGRIKQQFGKSESAKVAVAGNGARATVPANGVQASQPAITTATDYATKFTPLVDGVPWSAPAWANDQVRSEPHTYCIASGEDGREGCHCTTEQGTRVRMDLAQCWTLARYGEAYNPFKAPEREQARRQAQDPPERNPAPTDAVGTGEPVLVQPQGGFARVEPVIPAENAHF